MFLLDPARRQRIKLWGRARVVENDAALVEKLFDAGYKARPERAILFTIEAWDVNCSSHIVTRFTEAEIEQALTAVQAKIAELEAENARLRAALAQQIATARAAAMNHDSYPDSYIRGILNSVKTIAMVGISPKENRPSYFAIQIFAGARLPHDPGQSRAKPARKSSARKSTPGSAISPSRWTWSISSAAPTMCCRSCRRR